MNLKVFFPIFILKFLLFLLIFLSMYLEKKLFLFFNLLKSESTDILEYVLKRNSLDMTTQDKFLLHTAVKTGDVHSKCCFRVVRILLQQGVSAKVKDSSGKMASDYILEKFTITGSLLEIYTPGMII